MTFSCNPHSSWKYGTLRAMLGMQIGLFTFICSSRVYACDCKAAEDQKVRHFSLPIFGHSFCFMCRTMINTACFVKAGFLKHSIDLVHKNEKVCY